MQHTASCFCSGALQLLFRVASHRPGSAKKYFCRYLRSDLQLGVGIVAGLWVFCGQPEPPAPICKNPGFFGRLFSGHLLNLQEP